MDTNQDGSEVLETTENADGAPAGSATEETVEQKVARLEKEKAELDSRNKQLFERIKKAEKPTDKETPSQDGLSTKDVLYLAKADIHAEDVDDVVNYARKMGTTVAEAHKFFTPILNERAEQRRTAAATHTSGGARAVAKTEPADTLRRSEHGEVIDTDEGMQEIFNARNARRFRK